MEKMWTIIKVSIKYILFDRNKTNSSQKHHTFTVLAGVEIEKDHCVIEHHNGEVVLYPGDGALCVVNGVTVTSQTTLSQGISKVVRAVNSI
jgi:hypothetical protein